MEGRENRNEKTSNSILSRTWSSQYQTSETPSALFHPLVITLQDHIETRARLVGYTQRQSKSTWQCLCPTYYAHHHDYFHLWIDTCSIGRHELVAIIENPFHVLHCRDFWNVFDLYGSICFRRAAISFWCLLSTFERAVEPFPCAFFYQFMTMFLSQSTTAAASCWKTILNCALDEKRKWSLTSWKSRLLTCIKICLKEHFKFFQMLSQTVVTNQER